MVDKQRLRWIQEPEWSMGMDFSMQYVGRKRILDGVEYSFVDVTAVTMRIVTQYYEFESFHSYYAGSDSMMRHNI